MRITKRFAALLLCVLLFSALSVPVFAADGRTSAQESFEPDSPLRTPAPAPEEHGLTRAYEIHDPDCPSREEALLAELELRLEELRPEALATHEDMTLPEAVNMLETPRIRFVTDMTGRGSRYYDAPEGKELGRIVNSARAVVYADYEGWAFIRLGDGTVCWVKSISLTCRRYLY